MNTYKIYDKQGKIYSELSCTRINASSRTHITDFRRFSLTGYFDLTLGKLLTEAIYSDQKGFFQDYNAVKKNNTWGLIDKTGKEVVEFIYEDIVITGEKCFYGKLNGVWSLYNLNGIAVDGPYQGVMNLIYYLAVKCDNKWTIISHLPLNYKIGTYDSIESYSGQGIWVKNTSGTGFINSEFKQIIPCAYDRIDISKNGKYLRVKKDNCFGLFDLAGNEIIPCIYQDIPSFPVNEACIARLADKYGIINTNNETLVDFAQHEISLFNGDQYAIKRGSTYSIFDLQGNVLTKNKLQKVKSLVEKFRPVRRNKKWGYINETGQEVIPCQYDNALYFHKNYAFVLSGEKWLCINDKGQTLPGLEFDGLDIRFADSIDFRNGLTVVKKGNLFGVLSEDLKMILSCSFDLIQPFHFIHGYIIASKDGKFGLYDIAGSILIEHHYDLIDITGDGHIICGVKDTLGEAYVKGEPLQDGLETTFSSEFCANFHHHSYLKIHHCSLPEDWARIVVFALVDDNDGHYVNRLYLIDASKTNGDTATFLQGYVGGSEFSEFNFSGIRVINSKSDHYFPEDDDLIPPFSVDEFPPEIDQLIEPYTCKINEDSEEYQFESLKHFSKGNKGELLILYHVWVNGDQSLKMLWDYDRARLSTMIRKVGITLSDPLDWE
jgi:hypothetical protein